MIKTFATELKQFALSVDSIEKAQLSSIERDIKEYLKDILKAERSEFFLEGVVERKPGLKPQWDKSGDRDGGFQIGYNKSPQGHCGYCFYNHEPLWVTATEDEVLDKATEFTDHWSNSDLFPDYKKTNYTGFKTAIILPVKNDTCIFGLMYLGSNDQLAPNQRARNELLILAEAYGILFRLYKTNEHRNNNTEDAMKSMMQQFSGNREFILKKPSIFFAYPKKSDPDVLSIITKVLSDYKEDFDVIDWDNPSLSGSITQQLINNIAAAKCGICYFSEISSDPEDGDYAYIDNSNVLIEAGMLHALCNNPLAEPMNWIPIRENEDVSGPIPFDFASDAFVLINRDSGLNGHTLKSDLKSRLDDLKSRLQ